MDFATIRKQMEANVYKNVREIYADVRLVFSNAMKYNEDIKSDVHVMAKTLLEKFEEKWLQLLPKVIEAVSNFTSSSLYGFNLHYTAMITWDVQIHTVICYQYTCSQMLR